MTRIVLAALIVLGSANFGRTEDLPREKTYVNSLGMTLVRIEAGTFTMGSPTGGDFDERPVRKVTVSRPFYLGATEITNAQYEAFDPAHKELRGKLGFSTEDDEAVVFVSFWDAIRFCQWLSKKEGRPYRLPTEAEWEYACRAGTNTAYSTGDSLPKEFHKNPVMSWYPGGEKGAAQVSLAVGKTPANPWGLFDMHGNVEEWCTDWYAPYPSEDQTDPSGPERGDFMVTRGGSHSTTLEYLRSANRMGTLPEDKSWLIGFRVVIGLPLAGSGRGGLNPDATPSQPPAVQEKAPAGPALDPNKPYFQGPRPYVKIPAGSEGPMFSKHNHDPALVQCPNGDLLAIWYTCRSEPGRELGILCSRLRAGAEEWEPAAPFWDAPDRNDHAPALWADGQGTLYHFNGLSAAATWGNLATILRTSTDSGRTWSKARLIMPEHGVHHMPVESVIRTRSGAIILACDAVPGGHGGTAILISRDNGQTWRDPGEGKPQPTFEDGATGVWIAGIHAGVVELGDGRLMAFGRGNSINGHMPKSISADEGESWTYRASPFAPIGGGQRLVVLRLAEGPIFFASFARQIAIKDASGNERQGSGLYTALSFDNGENWSICRLVTDDGPPREIDGGGNTGRFTLSADSAELRGYLSVCQTPDGLIHLISSKQHYTFNLAWLKTPPPAK